MGPRTRIRSARPAPPAPTPANAPRRGRLAPWALSFSLALAVVVAHRPVLDAQAIALDDILFVVKNPLVNRPGWDSTRRFFTEVLAPSSVNAYYLPLSMTSLMLDAARGGRLGALGPYHVTSLALHVAATVLLFLLLQRLFGAALPAAFAALLYGLHPLTVEAIASAGERKTVLATALAFACVYAHVVFAQTRARAWQVATLGLFVLALLAKPSVLALPLALLVLDAWPLGRFSRATLLEKWPLFLLAAASSVITVLSIQRTWESGAAPPLDPLRLSLQIAWLQGFYLAKVAWPLNLSTVYAAPAGWNLADPGVAFPVVCVLLLAAIIFAVRKRWPELATGAAVYLILLVPTFGILRFSNVIAYDRYLYLPALGLAVAAAGLLARLWNEPGFAGPAARRVRVVVLVAVGLAEAVATRAALAPWRDSLSIWQQAVRVSPGVPDAQNGLGVTYAQLGQPGAAIACYRRALAAGPRYVDAHQNLGAELTRVGAVAEAIPHLEFAVRHAPGSATAHIQLGMAYQRAGRDADAERVYQRAVALEPGDPSAVTLLGVVEIALGHDAEGVAHLREALARSPGEPLASYSLAMALTELDGPSDEAARLLEDAIRARPDWAEARERLAWILATRPDSARLAHPKILHRR